MAVRIPAELRRNFFEFRRLQNVLHSDTELALIKLRNAVEAFNRGEGRGEEADFWCKVAIRGFMGEVDGLGYAMRRAVLRNAEECRLSLSTRERARLSEKRYDAATDTIVEEKAALLSPIEGIKEAFKYFTRLFGSDYKLATGGEGWGGFRRVVRVRNNFTHPRILEHLSSLNALSALQPTLVWFYGQVLDLFADIASRIGAVPVSRYPVVDVMPVFRESAEPWRSFFSDDDHLIIQKSGSKTLEYVKRFFVLLGKDTTRAMDLCNGGFGSLKVLRSPEYQFAFRTYLRTLFSEVEGSISAASFQLEAAKIRKTVTLTTEEDASLVEGDVEDRLASALTLWSREFGFDHVALRSGASWVALRRAREIRNNLTHPKKVEDLEIALKETGTILEAHGYLTSNMKALQLDENKWIKKAGSIQEAIAHEQRASEKDEKRVDEIDTE